MKIATTALFLCLLATAPAIAADDTGNINSGFGDSYFAETGHPGFSDPVGTEDVTKIEPAAGDETDKESAATAEEASSEEDVTTPSAE